MTVTSTSIPVERIIANPNQPRTTFDDQSIRELADSIAQNELLQPILVEDNQDGYYTLVGGERRLRAFKLLKRASIPAIVREKSNHGGRELLIHAVIENVQREDMNALDEAEAYQRMHTEFKMGWDEIAKRTGKHPASIQHRTILLKLDKDIQQMIRAGRLTAIADVARALLCIPETRARINMATKIVEARMTIKQAVASAKSYAAIIRSTRIEIGTAESPAMRLAQRSTRQAIDEKQAPAGWDALKQAGKVPPWVLVADSVTNTCRGCSLSEHANESVCRDCPMVDFLKALIGGSHG
jgi:ParB family chromosome partitioning protein